MTFAECVDLLPQILLYFLPGYIGINAFRCAATGYRKYEHIVLTSCAASYVAVAVVRSRSVELTFWPEVVWTCGLCMLVGVIVGRVAQSKWVYDWLTKYLHLRLSPATISSSIDWTKANAALVYLKTTPNYYLGSVQTVGDDGGDGWIAIGYPIYCAPDGTELWNCYSDENTVVVLPLSDVQAIRIINNA